MKGFRSAAARLDTAQVRPVPAPHRRSRRGAARLDQDHMWHLIHGSLDRSWLRDTPDPVADGDDPGAEAHETRIDRVGVTSGRA